MFGSCSALLFVLAVMLAAATTSAATVGGATLEQLHEELARLTRRVDAAEVENSRLRQEMTSLKRNSHRRQIQYPEEVGFTADVSHHLTNLGHRHTIVFDNVVSNIGDAYDPKTGYFIAPVPGTYMFFSNVMSEGQSGTLTYIETEIVTGNDTQLAEMYSGSQSGYDSTSNMAIVKLNMGDHVWVRVHGTWSNNFSIHCCFTTFSGYLLRIDEEKLDIIG